MSDQEIMSLVDDSIPELGFYQNLAGAWYWTYRCLDSGDIFDHDTPDCRTTLEAFIQFTKYILDEEDRAMGIEDLLEE